VLSRNDRPTPIVPEGNTRSMSHLCSPFRVKLLILAERKVNGVQRYCTLGYMIIKQAEPEKTFK
jgi:hypothetical protein